MSTAVIANESEQWKLHGDCSKCRKQSYCNKRCSAVKSRTRSVIGSLMGAYAERMLPGITRRY